MAAQSWRARCIQFAPPAGQFGYGPARSHVAPGDPQLVFAGGQFAVGL
jgi:hypothetical protein